MRVVVATANDGSAGWLHGVLTAAGLSVAILATPNVDSPELSTADLLVADAEAARVLGVAGPQRRLLLVSRGASVDMSALITGGYTDVLAVPSPEDEILIKVGHALDRLLRAAKPAPATRGKELRDVVAQAVRSIRQGPKADALKIANDRLSVLMLLVDSHESSERGTPSHSARVAHIINAACPHVGIESPDAEWLGLAARLHDVGLAALHLPLDQPAPLTAELRRSLAGHPTLSAEICEPLGPFGLPIEAIRHHHERPDGSGYPLGITDVAIDAQLLGAIDMYEALTAPRPWRPALARDEALKALAGFDHEVIDAVAKSVR